MKEISKKLDKKEILVEINKLKLSFTNNYLIKLINY